VADGLRLYPRSDMPVTRTLSETINRATSCHRLPALCSRAIPCRRLAGSGFRPTATSLRVAFDESLPSAQWGPLFHVLRLERPGLRLEWRPAGFPTGARSLLHGADVGVLLEPPKELGLDTLTIAVSPMVVVMAAGHRRAGHAGLRVADILDETFPGGRDLHPEWLAFWTLDAQRSGPPRLSHDSAHNVERLLDVVAAGRAITTLPASVAGGLPHPGVVTIPLLDGPSVSTRLVWHRHEQSVVVRSFVALAKAMTGELERDARV
jgi:DNA-binding transcriptional LysR family regulator